MKKTLFTAFVTLALIAVGVSCTYSATRIPAKDITVDASGFSGNLGPTDTDVQHALNTIDQLIVGGSQTPWTSDIDGGGYRLSNVGSIAVGSASQLTIDASGSLTTTGYLQPYYIRDYAGNIRFDLVANALLDDSGYYIMGLRTRSLVYQSGTGALLWNTNGEVNIIGKLGIYDHYTTISLYTYLQPSGTQTASITYTLPSATPTTDSQTLLCSTTGIWSWGTNFGSNNITTDGQGSVSSVVLTNTTTPATVAGTIYFDGTNFKGWNGTTWKQLDN